MNHSYNYRQNILPCVKVKHKQHRMGGDLVVDFDDKILLLTLDLMLFQALGYSIMHLTQTSLSLTGKIS